MRRTHVCGLHLNKANALNLLIITQKIASFTVTPGRIFYFFLIE